MECLPKLSTASLEDASRDDTEIGNELAPPDWTGSSCVDEIVRPVKRARQSAQE
jgi:hypothetical protein